MRNVCTKQDILDCNGGCLKKERGSLTPPSIPFSLPSSLPPHFPIPPYLTADSDMNPCEVQGCFMRCRKSWKKDILGTGTWCTDSRLFFAEKKLNLTKRLTLKRRKGTAGRSLTLYAWRRGRQGSKTRAYVPRVQRDRIVFWCLEPTRVVTENTCYNSRCRKEKKRANKRRGKKKGIACRSGTGAWESIPEPRHTCMPPYQ